MIVYFIFFHGGTGIDERAEGDVMTLNQAGDLESNCRGGNCVYAFHMEKGEGPYQLTQWSARP